MKAQALTAVNLSRLLCVLNKSAIIGVPLEVMLRFNRLKALSNDESVVAAALRKSMSGLMEVRMLCVLKFVMHSHALILNHHHRNYCNTLCCIML